MAASTASSPKPPTTEVRSSGGARLRFPASRFSPSSKGSGPNRRDGDGIEQQGAVERGDGIEGILARAAQAVVLGAIVVAATLAANLLTIASTCGGLIPMRLT